MDPCKLEVRPAAQEESVSPAWLATPAMNSIIYFYKKGELEKGDCEKEG